jgi:hypothetical protein
VRAAVSGARWVSANQDGLDLLLAFSSLVL